MTEYYVYGLIHPDTNLPFYIGKGKDNRARSHLLLKPDDVYNTRKRAMIEELNRSQKKIDIVYYDTGLSNTEAINEEKRLIRKYGRRDYDKDGILTNLTLGGEGGDTSQFFTEDSYRRMSRPGIKNPRAKLTEEQVIEIYHSTNSCRALSKQFGVGTGQINGIKKKRYYSNVTESINVLPGVMKSKCPRQILPIDIVKKIYLEEGTYRYFKERYNVNYAVVRRIKEGKSNKTITKELGPAGHVKKHNLTNTDISEIRQSKLSLNDLAEKFGVHRETIRNIISGKSHRFFRYEY